MNKFVNITLAGMSEKEYTVDSGVHLFLTMRSSASCDARVTVVLNGTGASATITGVLIGKKHTKQVLHTMQIHVAAETTSNLLIKTVLSGRALSIYDGGVRIEKSAQKSDAYQRNENLLLSDHAYAESKPSLEILANDVRCTHGATVGPVDPTQLWYLMSLGISKKKAQDVIVEGFIQSAFCRNGV